MKTFGTTVTFMKRSDGALIGYSAIGHSGYAEAGADIVCAAISALTQTMLNGLKNVLKAPVMFDQDDDGAFIEAKLTPEATPQQVQQALEAITVETLTPIEAMNELYKLKKMLD